MSKNMSIRLMLAMVITCCQTVIWTKAEKLSVTSHRYKMLHGHTFRNISNGTMTECLQHCLSDCLCLSFQICQNECQLCFSNKDLTPKDWIENSGCVAFEFWKDATENELDKQQCDQGCMTSLNCCVTSLPCLHGGKCNIAKQYSEQRFVCKCSNGYHGYRCEKMSCTPGFKGINCDEPIKSCRGYNNGSAVSGYYTLAGGRQKNTYKVFCDFSLDTAWTLIQSYSFENKDSFPLPFFRNNASSPKNAPVWKEYRLPKWKINSILSDSTKWRFTCNYDNNGTVYIDYVRGLTTELDIMHFDSGRCVKVQYINIRGRNCTDCMVYMMQLHDVPLHVRIGRYCGYNWNGLKECHDYNASFIGFERSFGYYNCYNTEHRCSSSLSSTTQFWLGG